MGGFRRYPNCEKKVFLSDFFALFCVIHVLLRETVAVSRVKGQTSTSKGCATGLGGWARDSSATNPFLFARWKKNPHVCTYDDAVIPAQGDTRLR